MRVTAPYAIVSGASCGNPYSHPKGLKYGWSFCNAGFLLPHLNWGLRMEGESRNATDVLAQLDELNKVCVAMGV